MVALMSQKILWLLLAISLVLLALSYQGRLQQTETATPDRLSPADSGEAFLLPAPQQAPARYLADISLHTVEELQLLFDRVDELVERPRSDREAPLVSLVLHGPEVEFFALANYASYKGLVDRAARLAALGAVDIRICQTRMKQLGIATDQVPAFLEQVPYGPDEVERLLGEGYVYM